MHVDFFFFFGGGGNKCENRDICSVVQITNDSKELLHVVHGSNSQEHVGKLFSCSHLHTLRAYVIKRPRNYRHAMCA